MCFRFKTLAPLSNLPPPQILMMILSPSSATARHHSFWFDSLPRLKLPSPNTLLLLCLSRMIFRYANFPSCRLRNNETARGRTEGGGGAPRHCASRFGILHARPAKSLEERSGSIFAPQESARGSPAWLMRVVASWLRVHAGPPANKCEDRQPCTGLPLFLLLLHAGVTSQLSAGKA